MALHVFLDPSHDEPAGSVGLDPEAIAWIDRGCGCHRERDSHLVIRGHPRPPDGGLPSRGCHRSWRDGGGRIRTCEGRAMTLQRQPGSPLRYSPGSGWDSRTGRSAPSSGSVRPTWNSEYFSPPTVIECLAPISVEGMNHLRPSPHQHEEVVGAARRSNFFTTPFQLWLPPDVASCTAKCPVVPCRQIDVFTCTRRGRRPRSAIRSYIRAMEQRERNAGADSA